jgi:hypothetical protein
MEGARTRAQGAMKELLVKWHEASEVWSDSTSKAFEKRYIEQLEQAVRAALPAMEKMSETLVRVQRECGDPH